MFAKATNASNNLTCDRCGHQLIETARETHPRLPAHEIRTYACRVCGAQAQISAPVPRPKDLP